MDIKEAITLCVDEARVLCGGHEEGCPRCAATDMLIEVFEIDKQQLTPIAIHKHEAAVKASCRTELEPHLVNLIAGLRRHQVKEAVALLLDYIDASSSTHPK